MGCQASSCEDKSTAGRCRDLFSLECKSKIKNESDQKIKVIVSYQPMTVTVRTKVEASVSVPFVSIEATAGGGRKIQIG
jgi:hypothetical protein